MGQISQALETALADAPNPAIAADMKQLLGMLGNYRVGLESLDKDPTAMGDLVKVGDRISGFMDAMEERQITALHALEKQAKDDAACIRPKT